MCPLSVDGPFASSGARGGSKSGLYTHCPALMLPALTTSGLLLTDFRSPRSLRLLGGTVIHVPPIGHTFVEVVPLGPPCSFCATCSWITGHPRWKRPGGESLTLLGKLGGNSRRVARHAPNCDANQCNKHTRNFQAGARGHHGDHSLLRLRAYMHVVKLRLASLHASETETTLNLIRKTLLRSISSQRFAPTSR